MKVRRRRISTRQERMGRWEVWWSNTGKGDIDPGCARARQRGRAASVFDTRVGQANTPEECIILLFELRSGLMIVRWRFRVRTPVCPVKIDALAGLAEINHPHLPTSQVAKHITHHLLKMKNWKAQSLKKDNLIR